jgi:hypothetical protein
MTGQGVRSKPHTGQQEGMAMRPTQPRALLIALLLGPVLVGYLGGCHSVPHHTPTPLSFQADAGPLVAVSPVTLSLSGAWQFALDPDAEGYNRG